MQDREGRRLGDRRKNPDRRKADRRKVVRGEEDRRADHRRGNFGKRKEAPDSPQHKKIGDETKNPLPDKDSAQKRLKNAGDGSGRDDDPA
jgi:hypothetical protein